jgi:acyl transferase domain-containing protein
MIYVKDPELPIRHAATGKAASMLANKISWFFDFRGPSIRIDTACSASLNALHLARQSLQTGESDMVNLTWLRKDLNLTFIRALLEV